MSAKLIAQIYTIIDPTNSSNYTRLSGSKIFSQTNDTAS